MPDLHRATPDPDRRDRGTQRAEATFRHRIHPTNCGSFSRSESGGIGRRAGFRIRWGDPWGFESPLSHQLFRARGRQECATGKEETLQVEVINEPAWKRRIQIEVSADQVSREYEETYRRFERNAMLPGFRKGKVPRNLVEKSFGKRIESEVVNTILDEAYRSAVRDNDIHPVSYPQIDKLDFRRGEPMTIHAIVEVRPEIDSVKLDKIMIERPTAVVGDEDVTQMLEALRQRRATFETSEGRKAESDDLVIVDQEAFDEEGLMIPKGCGADVAIPVNREMVRSEFVEALTGAAEDEERETEVEFSQDDADPAFRGRKIRFRFKVKEVKERILPDLDDDFASEVGEFETMSALEDLLRKDMERQATQRSEESVRGRLIDAVVEKNSFDVPETMLERYVENVVEDALRQNASQALDVEEVRDEALPMAKRSIKKMLLFEALQREHEIAVSEEELAEQIDRIASANNIPPRKMRVSLEKEGNLSRLMDELLEEKTFQFLLDSVEVKEEKS